MSQQSDTRTDNCYSTWKSYAEAYTVGVVVTVRYIKHRDLGTFCVEVKHVVHQVVTQLQVKNKATLL